MISNLSPLHEAFIANVDRVQRSVEDASRQTSSGKRVNVASDAPSEIDTILQLRTDAARNTQIQENLSVAKADADAADAALTAATKIMDRARVLAAQGANFTLDATGRQSIAGEVQSLHRANGGHQPDHRPGTLHFRRRSRLHPALRRGSHRGQRSSAPHQFARHTPRGGFRGRLLRRLQKRPGNLRYA